MKCPICQINFADESIEFDTYCPACTSYLQSSAYEIWKIKQERGEIK
jgi:Zn-finger nucleic acid-binding protein